jgi:hypothetical protein
VLKKIGLLTILGLLLLILSEIIYFNSLANTFIPQFGVIDLIGISGILLGLLFIILDVHRVKRRDVINEIHYDLLDFGKIFLVIFFALIVDIAIFSTSIREYAVPLGVVVFITIFLPLIVIGLGIFLILIRMPFHKSLSN